MAISLKAAQDAWVDNADYAATNSPAKARALITAGTQLMALQHSEAEKGGPAGAKEAISVELIRAEMTLARAWLAQHSDVDSESAIIEPDFTGFRK